MLFRYLEDFKNLNVNITNGEIRRYKPALLLAVMDGIEVGTIRKRQMELTSALVADFKKQMLVLVPTYRYQSRNLAYPFYHMQHEGFWRLKEKPGKQILVTESSSISGLRHLTDVVAYALIDVNLWDLLVNEANRAKLRETLISTYAERRQ